MTIPDILSQQIQQRLVTEGIHRLRICLQYLTDEQIWHWHNSNTPSIGNLILHLNGNVRQWLLQHISNMDFSRNRDTEFLMSSRTSRSELMHILAQLETDISKIDLSNTELTKPFTVQGFEETALSIIVHVIEHFSYHVGQATTLTKIAKDIDTGYYAGLDLNQVH